MKRRVPNPGTLKSAPPESESLYFRLCHNCLHLNESPEEVIECENCKSQFALDPQVVELFREFDRDDNEQEAEAQEERDEAARQFARYTGIRRKSHRLAGLSVHW